MPQFKLVSEFKPMGDQPLAIEQLVDGIQQGLRHQTLLGATGTGKSVGFETPVFIVQKQGASVKTSVTAIGPVIDSVIEQAADAVREEGETQIVDLFDQPIEYYAQAFNPESGEVDLYPIQSFTRHETPPKMYRLQTKCGRNATLTGDHNLWVLRDGRLQLIETTDARPTDYVPVPERLLGEGNRTTLNTLDILSDAFPKYDFVKKRDFDPKAPAVNRGSGFGVPDSEGLSASKIPNSEPRTPPFFTLQVKKIYFSWCEHFLGLHPILSDAKLFVEASDPILPDIEHQGAELVRQAVEPSGLYARHHSHDIGCPQAAQGGRIDQWGGNSPIRLGDVRQELGQRTEAQGETSQKMGGITYELGEATYTLGWRNKNLALDGEVLGAVPEHMGYIPKSLEALGEVSERLGQVIVQLGHTKRPAQLLDAPHAIGHKRAWPGIQVAIDFQKKILNRSNDFRRPLAKYLAMVTSFYPTDNPTQNSDNPTENSDNPTQNSDNPTENAERSSVDSSPRASFRRPLANDKIMDARRLTRRKTALIHWPPE